MQKGIALLTAMVVTFVCVAIGVELGARQQIDIARTDALMRSGEAYAALMDLEVATAEKLQRENTIIGNRPVPGYRVKPALDVTRWHGHSEIADLHYGFNVNDLSSESENREVAEARFRRLLGNLGLAPDLANAVMDWIDSDTERRHPNGAEDDVYIGLPNPYRAANGHLVRIEELKMVRGISEETFRRLSPFLSSLPVDTPVNINTASRQVLMIMSPEMTPKQVEAIVAARQRELFEDMDEVFQLPGLASVKINESDLVVDSTHYLVRSTVNIGERVYRMASYLNVTPERFEVLLRIPQEG